MSSVEPVKFSGYGFESVAPKIDGDWADDDEQAIDQKAGHENTDSVFRTTYDEHADDSHEKTLTVEKSKVPRTLLLNYSVKFIAADPTPFQIVAPNVNRKSVTIITDRPGIRIAGDPAALGNAVSLPTSGAALGAQIVFNNYVGAIWANSVDATDTTNVGSISEIGTWND